MTRDDVPAQLVAVDAAEGDGRLVFEPDDLTSREKLLDQLLEEGEAFRQEERRLRAELVPEAYERVRIEMVGVRMR